MERDIWNDLSETISKTARDLGAKADVFIETQKLQGRAASEKRMVEKQLRDLGNVIYRRFVDGAELDEELRAFCEEITRRQTVIAGYKEEYARLKGRRICPECGESIPKSSVYCPKCGAYCYEEPEEDIAADAAETVEEAAADAAGPEEDIAADAGEPEKDAAAADLETVPDGQEAEAEKKEENTEE